MCPKCKDKLYHLDLILSFNCKCNKKPKNNSSKFFHINKLYNKLEFKEENSPKENAETKYYILISKKILLNIQTLFFPYQKDLFNFSNKNEIEEEPYFIEECLDEFTKKVQKLENNNISKDCIEIIKALILDINIFIIILKKNPSFKINEINIINVLYKNKIDKKNQFIQTLKEYLHNIKEIENSFNDGFNYEFYSKSVQCILPIQDKKIILFLLHDSRNKNDFEFRLYDINNIKDNNYLCLQNFSIQFPDDKNILKYIIKLYNIDSKIILIDYFYNFEEHFIYFIEIEYDKNNKPINIKLLSKEKYKDINIIINDICDLDCFNEDSIIFIGKAKYSSTSIFIFRKIEENNFYLVKKMFIEKNNNTFKKINFNNNIIYDNNKVLADNYNKQIIFYYDINKFISSSEDSDEKFYYISINFYNYDLNLKKSINFEEIVDLSYPHYSINILNKENYIISFNEKICLISAKYLEIITIYNLHIYIWSIFVPNNSNRILIVNDPLNFKKENYKYNENRIMSIYKLCRKELKYVGKEEYINKEIFDIKEINEKGDHILVTNSLLDFNFKDGVKKISNIYHIKDKNNENNKNIKKVYSMFKTKKKNLNKNKYLYDEYDYYYDDYDYEYQCSYEYCCWHWFCYWNNYYYKYGYNYIYKKEDKHFIKKRYKNKGKRKYINFRNIKKKKKYEKYKSNKNNLNKYENEDIYEDLQENNYYYDKEEDESSYFY